MSILKAYIESLESRGCLFFTRKEALENLKVSNDVFKVMIYRLVKEKRIISLSKQFCLVVPIQYRTLGAPPPEWYLHEFMSSMKTDYYVSGLTAAAYHGASHHAVQVYQVMVTKQIRPLTIGRTRYVFLYKNKKAFDNIESKFILKTNKGIHLSSPELTTLDLLMYKDSIGSLNTIMTALVELAPLIRIGMLLSLKTPLVHIQRLGYIWERTEQKGLAGHIYKFLELKRLRYHLLEPKIVANGEKNKKWHLMINAVLEPDDI
jgi:predicted transcriptional regulator of viral defense system